MLATDDPYLNHEEPQRWQHRLAYFLFFLMLAFPTVRLLAYPKMALFAVLLACVLIQGLTRLRLHNKVVVWTIALAAVSVFFGLRGLFLNARGAFACLRMYAMWPLIYLVLLSGIRSMAMFRGFRNTMVYSTIFVSLFGIYLFLSHLNFVPHIPFESFLLTPEEVESGLLLSVSARDGHVVMEIPGENSFPFLMPFLFALAVNGGFSSKEKWSAKLWLALALFLGLTIVILSGRRGLQLVTILSPFLTFALGMLQPGDRRRPLLRSLTRATISMSALVVLALLLLGQAYSVTVKGLSERFSAGFDFSASNLSDSTLDRVPQYFYLKERWTQSPFLGYGLGAVATPMIRGAGGVLWAQELSYLNLLFQTGIFGMMAYTAGIIWIYWMGLRIIRGTGELGRLMLPLLVGMSSLLIANVTNPYLAGFDMIWPIFLPLALINHWLLEHEPRQAAELR